MWTFLPYFVLKTKEFTGNMKKPQKQINQSSNIDIVKLTCRISLRSKSMSEKNQVKDTKCSGHDLYFSKQSNRRGARLSSFLGDLEQQFSRFSEGLYFWRWLFFPLIFTQVLVHYISKCLLSNLKDWPLSHSSIKQTNKQKVMYSVDEPEFYLHITAYNSKELRLNDTLLLFLW